MTLCKECGKTHGMVIEDQETGETSPIDWCKECLFDKGYEKTTPPALILEAPSFDELRERMMKLQDEIIRAMLLATAVPPEVMDALSKPSETNDYPSTS